MRHVAVVGLAEVVCQEEVAVLVVVGHANLKFRELAAALRTHRTALRGLLRHHRLQRQLAKLQVGTDTEERCGARDERRVGGEAHVTCLQQLDDLILLTVILQLHLLRVEVKGRLRVVVHVQVHLVTNPTVDAQVDLLVEVESEGVAAAGRQRRVVDALLVESELQFGRSLRLDLHATRSENLLCGTQVKLHVREVKLLLLSLLLKLLLVLVAEVSIQRALHAPCRILLGSHQQWHRQVRVANLVTHDVRMCLLVVGRLCRQVLRVAQVHRLPLQVLLVLG